MTLELITGAAGIEKAIKSIKVRGAKLDKDIHIAACSIIQHIEEHGDITLATRLHAAMPKGSRGNALIAWFEEFGKLTWLDAEAAKAAGKEQGFAFNRDAVTKLEEGMEKPWTDFKKEPPYRPINFKELLKKTVLTGITRKKLVEEEGKNDMVDERDLALAIDLCHQLGIDLESK